MYRLADSAFVRSSETTPRSPVNAELDLPELRARAFEHIARGLSVANVPHEMFSRFSATFADVRRVRRLRC